MVLQCYCLICTVYVFHYSAITWHLCLLGLILGACLDVNLLISVLLSLGMWLFCVLTHAVDYA